MSFREQYTFWRLAHYLVSVEQYRIIKVTEDEREIWLEKLENKNVQLIRLYRYDLDWANWMQRDMEMTLLKSERLRQQVRKGQFNVVNVYVSTYPPVDDYEYRLESPLQLEKNKKTSLSTIIFERSNLDQAIMKFNKELNSDISIEQLDEYSENDVELVKNSTIKEAKRRVKVEADLFQYGKPFFTHIFMTVQIIIFLMMEMTGSSTDISTLIDYGAKFNILIIEGEWWRFITPMFIHIGFLHLFMNTIALYYLGTAVERIFGNVRFLFIYFLAGFAGSLASFVYSSSISAGASGAIFGCFGALLYFGLIYPRLFFRTMGMNVLVVVGINLMLGFTIPMIDNAGHLGGLVGGFLATAIVHFPKKKLPLLQLSSLIIAIFLSVNFLSTGYKNNAETAAEDAAIIIAQDAINKEDFQTALRVLLVHVTDIENPSVDAVFTIGYAQLRLNMVNEALASYLYVIEERPDFPEAHYYLAALYHELNDLDKALEHAEKAVDLRPKDKSFKEMLDIVIKTSRELELE